MKDRLISTRAAAAALAALLVWGAPGAALAGPATPESAATPETARPGAAAPAPDPGEETAGDGTAAPLAAGDVVTDAVSPIGTTINLFDYWLTTQDAPDNYNPTPITQGINAGHELWFWLAPYGSGINDYTGSAAPRTGMVADVLQNGYPLLNQGDQSLNYLFDPSISTQGKASYPNAGDLLQIDADGYYYYNCTQNFAQYDKATGNFILYDGPGVLPSGATQTVGQFFPFNDYAQVKDLYARNAAINHYFGLTMTTRFVQQPYGTVDGTPGGTQVTYQFTGDDDVWVFIDDVLVGDLGGIHDAASLDINFATGQVSVNGQANGTLRDKFLAAGKTWINGSSPTFADDTYHTLKFFYLERGNVDSNMMLKFNLVSIPQSDLLKVDQIGDPVPGASFDLYYASDDYTPQTLIATGTTGADGTFVFQNPDGTLLSLNNLKNEYGGPGQTGKFVLIETGVPAGYRSPGPVELYFPPGYDQLATLLSANPWDTGAYASPMVTVTLPDAPRGLDGQSFAADSGAYFAVVLKRQSASGTGASDDSDWYPVHGDPIDGWTVETSTDMNAVLTAAKASPYQFYLDSSGAYKATIENLPGDILTYYDVLAANDELTADNAQYTVAFYHTTAPTLAGADAANTVRLNADIADGPGAFEREYAVRLYVPDIKNYLFVQKLAQDGATPLNGAQFALYTADQVENGQLKPGAQPFDTVTTRDLDPRQGDPILLGGAGTFPSTRSELPDGTYYLKETAAPAGYAPSDDLVEVIVDDTDVYADAGAATDDVDVLRGVGKIVRSMLQFAVPDDINATLTDIKAALYTAASYTPGTGDDWSVWTASGQAAVALSYDGSTQVLEYGPTYPGELPYFVVNAGWSRLKITQNYPIGDTALKTDLGSQDLSHLFARTTIVQVKDQATRLVIEKLVAGSMGDKTLPFAFTITLRDAAGAPLTGDIGGLTFDAEGVAHTTLAHTQQVVLPDLPAGTQCTVTEYPAANYHTTVRVNGAAAVEQNEVTVTAAAGLQTVLFINRSTLTPTPAPTASPAPGGTAAPEPQATPTPTPAAGLPPATGDALRPGLWLGLGAAALGALGFVMRRRSKRK